MHNLLEEFKSKIEKFSNSEESFVLYRKKNVEKDILFLTATHGDEKIGVDALSQIEKNEKIDSIVVNQKAYSENARYIKHDMNRIAPGNLDSNNYEEHRVAEVLEMCKKYNYVVDLHGTVSNSGIFIILTKLSFDDLLLALQFNIPNIVVWLPSKPRPTGPIVQFHEPAIEIECGPKNSEKVTSELVGVLDEFIQNYKNKITKKCLQGKNIFFVDGKIEKSPEKLIDFERTEIEGEEFYPLLVGEYGISCYKMKKIF